MFTQQRRGQNTLLIRDKGAFINILERMLMDLTFVAIVRNNSNIRNPQQEWLNIYNHHINPSMININRIKQRKKVISMNNKNKFK